MIFIVIVIAVFAVVSKQQFKLAYPEIGDANFLSVHYEPLNSN